MTKKFLRAVALIAALVFTTGGTAFAQGHTVDNSLTKREAVMAASNGFWQHEDKLFDQFGDDIIISSRVMIDNCIIVATNSIKCLVEYRVDEFNNDCTINKKGELVCDKEFDISPSFDFVPMWSRYMRVTKRSNGKITTKWIWNNVRV